MAKIRKNTRRKRYLFNKNRKRMRKNQMPKIQCGAVDKQWDHNKSTVKNLKEMGLVFNVNKEIAKGTEENSLEPKTMVVDTLEMEANAPRERCFRIPRNQVEFLTYMLDKYGEDYKAMTRDKKNHAQLTWKQFRTKVNIFKGIPEQYNQFLESRKGKLVESSTSKIPIDDDDD